MEVTFAHIKETLVVMPHENLTTIYVKDFTRKVVDEARKTDCANLLIDFSDTDFIDSHGFGSLVYLSNYMENRGGIMAVCGTNPQQLGAMKLLHLEDKLAVYPTKFEALKALESQD